MATAYKHRATIVTPTPLITEANHLACLMGESPADIETFKQTNYQDAQGNLYAVCSTVVTDTFMAAQVQGLPPTRPHAEGIVDRALAQAAYDSLGMPGGMMMVVDPDAQAALQQMGLTIVQPVEEEII